MNNKTYFSLFSVLIFLGLTTVSSAYFLDDFETDTSASYTYSDSYGGGGSFDISGGTLNVNAAGGNTAAVMTTDAVDFGIGQTVAVDMPAQSDMFLMVSTVAAQPNGTSSFGIRLRRDTAGLRMHVYPGGIVGSEISDSGLALTAWIERTADTEFAAYVQFEGDLLPTLIEEFTLAELAGINQLHIGTQAWAAPASFDNLKVSKFGIAPTPGNGADMVSINPVLSWVITPEIVDATYDVYFGSDPNTASNTPVSSGQTSTTYTPGTLQYDTIYYWKVVIHDGGDTYGGSLWSFETTPETPVIIQEPQAVTLEAGETATYTIAGENIQTYKWYKEGDADVLSTTDTLTIASVDADDEAQYYCIAANTAGNDESEHVGLWIKGLVAHWNFDGDLSDTEAGWAGVWSDPNELLDVSGQEIYGAGLGGSGQSLECTGNKQFVKVTGSEDYFNFYPLGITVNSWINTSVSGWQALASKRDGGLGYNLYATSGGTEAAYIIRDAGQASDSDDIVINDSEWHMVTGIYETETGLVKLYVDGKFRGQVGPYASVAKTEVPLFFGVSALSGGSSLTGLIDEISIWNYAVDPYEIARMYTDFAGGTVCVDRVGLDLDVAGPADDIDGNPIPDCKVDIYDFAALAAQWLNCNLVPASSCL